MPVTLNGSAGVTTNSGAVYDGLQTGTAVASTSGTSIDFTGIPSWVKRITVLLNGISLTGSAAPLIQLGTSGGIQSSGYLGAGADGPTLGAANYTTGFGLRYGSSGVAIHGAIQIFLLNASTNTWVASGTTANSTGASVGWTGGSVSLSGTLDRVRITSTGTDTFDAGSINIIYE